MTITALQPVASGQALTATMTTSFRLDVVPALFDPANPTLARAWEGTRRLLVVRDAGCDVPGAERSEKLLAYLRHARETGSLDDFLDVDAVDLDGGGVEACGRVVEAALKAQLGRRDAFLAFGGEQIGRIVAVSAASFRRHTAAIRVHRDLAAIVACLRDGLKAALDDDPITALARSTRVIVDEDGLLAPRDVHPGEANALLLLSFLDRQLLDRAVEDDLRSDGLSAIVRLCRRLGPGHPAWSLGDAWLPLMPKDSDAYTKKGLALLTTARVAHRLGRMSSQTLRRLQESACSLLGRPLPPVAVDPEAARLWVQGIQGPVLLPDDNGNTEWVELDRNALTRALLSTSDDSTLAIRCGITPDLGPRMSLGARLRVEVPVGFPVRFTDNVLDPDSPALATVLNRRSQVLAVVDPFHPDQPQRVHRLLAGYRERGYISRFAVLPAVAGEHAKTMEQVARVVNAAEGLGLDSDDRILVFGGGCVMDIVGYAAYLYRRDTPYVRIPTTLVGMIDAGIGLKVGVNVNSHKNLLGAYHPPLACLCDMGFLSTLSTADIRCGLSEAIKIAAVCDPKLFALIEQHYADVLAARDTPQVREILERSIAAMLDQLSANPFEEVLRRLPDYGHEFGHALESLSGYRLRHGEAVGIGMALSSCLAVRTGYLARADHERLLKLLTDVGLILHDPVCDPQVLWRRLHDEVVPHKAGRLHLVVPRRMGEGGFIDSIEEISPAMLSDSCEELNRRSLEGRDG